MSRDDLNYTADGLRDTASKLGRDSDEQHIQSTMLEEIALAIHRLAEAQEAENELFRDAKRGE